MPKNLSDENGLAHKVLKKFEYVLDKNEGLTDLVVQCRIEQYWQFAPVTSIKVERFFSLLRKVIGSDRPFKNSENYENTLLYIDNLEKSQTQLKVINYVLGNSSLLINFE